MPSMSFDSARTYPNFFRRYKWAFRAEYDNFENPAIAHPELHKFIHMCAVILKVNHSNLFSISSHNSHHTTQAGNPIPSEHIVLARSILLGLIESNNSGGWAGVWACDRIQVRG